MNALSKLLFSALAAVIFTTLSACAPYHFVDAPRVIGQVVSQSTHNPIAGAAVSMTARNTTIQTRTDQTGNFSLPAIQHWTIITISDGFFPYGTLRVQASGYHPLAVDGVGSPRPERIAPNERFGSVEGGGYTPRDTDIRVVHIALAPGA